MIKIANEKETINKLMEAMKSGNEEEIKKAWELFHNSISESIKTDIEEATEHQDKEILMQRGYRQLTSKETAFYQKVIDALKSTNPKQMFTEIIGSSEEDDLMPQTILEDVYKDLVEEHPLLAKINFVNVSFLTKWIKNDHTVQTAVWGAINSEITQEITSAFEVEDIDQNKLSAFAIIEKDMLDLGPTFLDAYIRTTLKEALAVGLETGIIKGNGLNEPIGMIKNLTGSIDPSTGYPDKAKVAVTSFAPAEYGALLAQLAVNEKGRTRKFTSAMLICNQVDYLTKVMPATTVMNTTGGYVNNVFPFPTEVVISNVLDTNDAVLVLPAEYFMGMGASKDGVLEYSDDYKFIEDQRVFKIKTYGAGKCSDNTCALYLDITNLDPAYITVKNVAEATIEA